ncbi:MAG: SLC13 family permease [Candidatus Cloacimonadaceae bacterium]
MFAMFLVLAVFVITYLLIITEWVNKMTIALLGGFLIIACRILTQEQAYSYVDWNVIFLLIGMMIIMGVLRDTGVFQYVAIKTAKLAKGNPIRILLFMFVVTAIISAFLDNVTTVMIIVPVNILIASELGISPIPFIVTQAVASNVGGTATLIGDPPNIMIGSATGLNFMDFVLNLTPVIIIITLLSLIMIYFMFKSSMHVSNERKAKLMEYDTSNLITNRPLLIKVGIVLGLLIIAFVLQGYIGINSATLAIIAAMIILIMSNRKEVEHIMSKSIDWVSLFFFVGLFIIVGGLNETGVLKIIANFILSVTHSNLKLTAIALVWFSGILSAVIDNVPFVATMIPLIKTMGLTFGNSALVPLWWSLSLGACLGGNGTLIGASANIVSVGLAKKSGYSISFWTFTKYSFSLMFMSLIVSTLYIYLRYFMFV